MVVCSTQSGRNREKKKKKNTWPTFPEDDYHYTSIPLVLQRFQTRIGGRKHLLSSTSCPLEYLVLLHQMHLSKECKLHFIL